MPGRTRTFGPAYEPALDAGRVRTQMAQIARLMLDGRARTLGEIEAIFRARGATYPQASISAQLRHLRKREFGGLVVSKRRRGKPGAGLWEYSVSLPPKPAACAPVQLSLLEGAA